MARIVHAYLKNDELVVCKSDLHDFGNREPRETNLPLFLRYMASQPVGDTKAVPPKSRRQRRVQYYQGC